MTCISTESLMQSSQTTRSTTGLSLVTYSLHNRNERLCLLADHHVIVFILKGTKLIHFPEETIGLKNNEMIVVEKGRYIMSQICDDEQGFKSLIILIEDKLLSNDFEPLNNFGKTNYFKVNCSEYLVNEIKNIDALSIKDTQAFNKIIQSKVDHIFSYLNSTNGDFKQFLSSLNSSKGTLSMVDALLPHVDSFKNVSHMAKKFNMSSSTFHRHFSRFYGQTPKNWLNNRKLELSIRHLKNWDLSITEVAFLSGFDNFTNFIRVFSQKYGLPPGRYRSQFCQKLHTN